MSYKDFGAMVTMVTMARDDRDNDKFILVVKCEGLALG